MTIAVAPSYGGQTSEEAMMRFESLPRGSWMSACCLGSGPAGLRPRYGDCTGNYYFGIEHAVGIRYGRAENTPEASSTARIA